MTFNYGGAQSTALRLITKFGAAAGLKRGADTRAIIAVETDQFARDANGQMTNPVSIIVLIASKGLAVPPDYKRDVYVDFTGRERQMTAPPTNFAPGGVSIYYEARVVI